MLGVIYYQAVKYYFTTVLNFCFSESVVFRVSERDGLEGSSCKLWLWPDLRGLQDVPDSEGMVSIKRNSSKTLFSLFEYIKYNKFFIFYFTKDQCE